MEPAANWLERGARMKHLQGTLSVMEPESEAEPVSDSSGVDHVTVHVAEQSSNGKAEGDDSNWNNADTVDLTYVEVEGPEPDIMSDDDIHSVFEPVFEAPPDMQWHWQPHCFSDEACYWFHMHLCSTYYSTYWQKYWRLRCEQILRAFERHMLTKLQEDRLNRVPEYAPVKHDDGPAAMRRIQNSEITIGKKHFAEV